jgi:methylenetetrahydrofolate dehydrogenase (NADP+)/methenyltetrahydrofolate cyclohydrolase
MVQLLKGAPVAAALNEQTAAKVKALAGRGIIPTLAIVRVGETPGALSYERGAQKRCEGVGVRVRLETLPGDSSQTAVVTAIGNLNRDAQVHGVLLLCPLPKHIDENAVRNTLRPEKDVDGITDLSLAGLLTGKGTGFAPGYAPCTAQACIELLDYYGIALQGKHAVVIGRSLVVGKPVSLMLLARHATVTVCHTRTVDMPSVCRNAEILIVSCGRANLVDASYLSPGQIIVDVGINADNEGNLCGDVNFAEASTLAAALTPVPGGVGSVTTAVLAKHVVCASIGS